MKCTENWQVSPLRVWFVSLGIGFFALLSACEQPEDIGSSLLKDNLINTLYTDTLTVTASTVMLDSVRTSQSGTCMVGGYTDPVLGRVDARGFLQFAPTDGLFDVPNLAEFDSLLLYLPYKSTQGDTLKRFTLNVHKLTEILDTNSTAKTFLKDDLLAYDRTPIISRSFAPRSQLPTSVGSYDTLRIKLPPTFGKSLFDKAGNADIQTSNKFAAFFKGLVLTSDNASNAVLNFTADNRNGIGIKMRMFYHPFRKDSSAYKELVLHKNHFNNIVHNRAGTKLAALQNTFDQVLSSKTNGEAYIQNGSGVSIKLELPYLDKFDKAKKLSINRAELVLKPDKNPSNVRLVSSTYFFETDKTNKVLRSTYGLPIFVPSEGNTLIVNQPATSIASGAQLTGAYSADDNAYTMNVTTYLQALLQNRRNNNGILMVTNTEQDLYRTLVNTKNIKLKVYYTYSVN